MLVVVVLAAGSSVVLAYVLTHQGIKWAGAAAAAVVMSIWILSRQGNGLLAAVVVLLAVPLWIPHVWLVAPLVGTIGLAAGLSRTRLRGVDVAVFLLVLAFVLSWVTHPELEVPLKVLVQGLLPFGFYLWARLTISESLIVRLQWTILLAGALGACSVLYEAARGVPVFVPPHTSYQWAVSTLFVFRPGGIFGGSPTAAVVLGIVIFASVSLLRDRPKLVSGLILLILAAIGTTLDRAGAIGLVAGTPLVLVLLPYHKWRRIIMIVLAVAIPVYAVTTSPSLLNGLGQSRLVQAGIIRSVSLTDRLQLASESAPLLADSPSHLLFGRGFFALAGPGRHDSRLAASTFLWDVEHGPNDDYLRAWLEQGIVGLLALLAWLGGALLIGVRTAMRLPPGSRERLLVAGLTAAALCYIIGNTTGDQSNNLVALSAGALITGMLVSVCNLYTRQSCPPPRPAKTDGPAFRWHSVAPHQPL